MSRLPRHDEATIPEIATTTGRAPRSLRTYAARNALPYREVPAAGRPLRIYPLAAWPEQIAAVVRRTRARQTATDVQAAPASVESLPQADRHQARVLGAERFARLAPDNPKRLRAEARYWLLERQRAYAAHHDVSPTEAVVDFLHDLSVGAVVIPPDRQRWLVTAGRVPHQGTFYRWRADFERDGLWGLVDHFGNRRGQSKIATTPALAALLDGLFRQRPGIRSKDIKALLKADYPDLDVVSEKSIARYMAQWQREHANAALLGRNPDAWKSHRQSAMGTASEGIERLCQVWEVDATPGDWMLIDGRHSVSGVIDVYSRTARLLVTKTPRAAAHAALLRRTMLDPLLGVPESIRHDQGQDYVAESLVKLCADLGVERLPCPPFTPERKPHIERFFQTMSHGILELLPGFIGHNVGQRQEIESRRTFASRIMSRGAEVEVPLTADQLQDALDRWVTQVYANTPHRGLDGKTPFQRVTEWRGERRRVEERALDLLLDYAGRRMVTKKGIALDRGGYIHANLGVWIGEWVDVYRDPTDLGRIIVHGTLTAELAGVWFDADTGETFEPGQRVFVCIAEDPERTGISRAEVATVARKRQDAMKKALTAAGRDARKALKGVDIAQAVLAQHEREFANVEPFPGPVVPHVTDALRAAADAADSLEAGRTPGTVTPLTEEQRALKARVLAEEARVAEAIEDSPKARYAYWARVQRRVDAGEALAPELLARLAEYQRGPEHELMAEMFKELGISIEHGRSAR